MHHLFHHNYTIPNSYPVIHAGETGMVWRTGVGTRESVGVKGLALMAYVVVREVYLELGSGWSASPRPTDQWVG